MQHDIHGADAAGDRSAQRAQLLTVDQVADALQLSARTIWKLAAAGSIPPPIKIGGSTRWRAGDLEQLIARAPSAGGGEGAPR